jgi:hypothetical protein
MHDLVTRHAQTLLPVEIHRRLHTLAYETGRSIAALLLDGALLVLRHHGRADGLGEPTAPLPPPRDAS